MKRIIFLLICLSIASVAINAQFKRSKNDNNNNKQSEVSINTLNQLVDSCNYYANEITKIADEINLRNIPKPNMRIQKFQLLDSIQEGDIDYRAGFPRKEDGYKYYFNNLTTTLSKQKSEYDKLSLYISSINSKIEQEKQETQKLGLYKDYDFTKPFDKWVYEMLTISPYYSDSIIHKYKFYDINNNNTTSPNSLKAYENSFIAEYNLTNEQIKSNQEKGINYKRVLHYKKDFYPTILIEQLKKELEGKEFTAASNLYYPADKTKWMLKVTDVKFSNYYSYPDTINKSKTLCIMFGDKIAVPIKKFQLNRDILKWFDLYSSFDYDMIPSTKVINSIEPNKFISTNIKSGMKVQEIQKIMHTSTAQICSNNDYFENDFYVWIYNMNWHVILKCEKMKEEYDLENSLVKEVVINAVFDRGEF